jgi:hypothetical protein
MTVRELAIVDNFLRQLKVPVYLLAHNPNVSSENLRKQTELPVVSSEVLYSKINLELGGVLLGPLPNGFVLMEDPNYPLPDSAAFLAKRYGVAYYVPTITKHSLIQLEWSVEVLVFRDNLSHTGTRLPLKDFTT